MNTKRDIEGRLKISTRGFSQTPKIALSSSATSCNSRQFNLLFNRDFIPGSETGVNLILTRSPAFILIFADRYLELSRLDPVANRIFGTWRAQLSYDKAGYRRLRQYRASSTRRTLSVSLAVSQSPALIFIHVCFGSPTTGC